MDVKVLIAREETPLVDAVDNLQTPCARFKPRLLARENGLYIFDGIGLTRKDRLVAAGQLL